MVVVPAPSAAAFGEGALRAGPIAILVVDSQQLFLSALATLLGAPPLSADVTTCTRSDQALQLVRGKGVDLVFCDYRAQPLTGPELIVELAKELPDLPVVLLGDRRDEEQLARAVRSAAAGVFTKDATLDELLAGLHAVLDGHRAVGARLMARLVERLGEEPADGSERARAALSRTEREILAMVGDAESISAIAATRGVSHKTVRNHLTRIYRKLELHGRTEAMLWAARRGLTSQ